MATRLPAASVSTSIEGCSRNRRVISGRPAAFGTPGVRNGERRLPPPPIGSAGAPFDAGRAGIGLIRAPQPSLGTPGVPTGPVEGATDERGGRQSRTGPARGPPAGGAACRTSSGPRDGPGEGRGPRPAPVGPAGGPRRYPRRAARSRTPRPARFGQRRVWVGQGHSPDAVLPEGQREPRQLPAEPGVPGGLRHEQRQLLPDSRLDAG